MGISFRFRPIPFVATVLLVALGVSLGQWQDRRAAEKTALQQKLTARAAEAPLALGADLVPAAPLEYRNVPALVQLWIGAVKGASFDIHYLVQDPVTGEDCVRATSHLAFVEESTGRVLRLTPEQKEKLGRFAPVSAS